MTRFPRAALVLLFISAPALAQSTAYSFDNFDTRNGVRVYVEPAKPQVANSSITTVRQDRRGKQTSSTQNRRDALDDPVEHGKAHGVDL